MAKRQQARRLKTFHARKEVLITLSDAELVESYRLDREGGILIIDLVGEAL